MLVQWSKEIHHNKLGFEVKNLLFVVKWIFCIPRWACNC